jgi:hypothetical protein
MFLATPSDKTSSHWTQTGPQPHILSRIALLALKSLNTLETLLSDENHVNAKFKVVFVVITLSQ